MKTLAVVMLSWAMLCILFSKFIPVPFLGTVLTLSLYPFAKMLSWYQCFWVYLTMQFMAVAVGFEYLILMFQWLGSYTSYFVELSGIPMWAVLPLSMVFGFFSSAVVQTTLVKFLCHYGMPKMIRRLGF